MTTQHKRTYRSFYYEGVASVYCDPKRSGSLGGVDNLFRDVKEEGEFKLDRKHICTSG